MLLRPISKRDLFEAFNGYRMLVGADEDKVDTLRRLYGNNKRSQNNMSTLRGSSSHSQHRDFSSTNLLKERGYESLIPADEIPKPSPPIANPNYDYSQPLYEARKYLKQVIVTFKGLKKEKLWQ